MVKSSLLLAVVNPIKQAERRMLNPAMIPSLDRIEVTQYSTAIGAMSSSEANMVVIQ
jgi:hypothetical protein